MLYGQKCERERRLRVWPPAYSLQVLIRAHNALSYKQEFLSSVFFPRVTINAEGFRLGFALKREI